MLSAEERDGLRDRIAEVIRLGLIDEDATYEQVADEVVELLAEEGRL